MTDFLLSQMIAAIAFGCGVISFQSRARRSILLWLCASSFANACHYFILGRPTPGVLFLIICARNLAASYTVNRKVMYVFFGLILVGFFFSYESPIGFLGLFATLTATYASFQTTDRGVRVFMMLANASWTIHDIVVGSPVGAVMEATFLMSNAIGYWRFHLRDNATPDKDLVTEEREG